MGNWVYVRNKKTKPNEPGWWPEKKKQEAIMTYLATGNLTQTAVIINVPRITVKKWKESDWWKKAVQDFHDEDNQELDAKYTKIIKKALDVVGDRLENGNFMFDQKTGKIVRIPVNINDASKALNDANTHRRLIRHEPTQVSVQQETVNDKLANLAMKFAEMALGKKQDDSRIVGEVYENYYNEEHDNAVHDRGQEGLQEGKRELQLETSTEEEQGTEEQSETNDDCSGEGKEG